MSLRPSAIVEQKFGPKGMYVAIDDPDTTGVLLIPCSFAHRRVASRSEISADFDVYPSQPSSRDEEVREALEEIASYGAKVPDASLATFLDASAAEMVRIARRVLADETTSGGER